MSRIGFFPYPTAPDALELVCTSDTPAVEVITENTIFAYEAPETENLGFDLKLDVPAEVFQTVLPTAERKHPPVQVVVTIRSIESRYRDLVVLTAGNGNPQYAATLLIPKTSLYGMVHFEPAIIRTDTGTDARYAAHVGAKLAWGQAVTLVVDEPPIPPGAYLEIKWEDFFTGGNPRRRAHADNLYYLDLEPETPVLYLNERIPDFKEVMQTRARRGYNLRVRDSTFDTIASQVWTTLLSKAITSLAIRIATAPENDEDDPLESLSEWEQRVLHFWAPRMYPSLDKEAALAEVQSAARSYEVVLPELMENMSSAVQTWIKSADVFRGIVRLITGEGI